VSLEGGPDINGVLGHGDFSPMGAGLAAFSALLQWGVLKEQWQRQTGCKHVKVESCVPDFLLSCVSVCRGRPASSGCDINVRQWGN